MVFNNRQMPQSVLYTAERHAETGGQTLKNRLRCCRIGKSIALRRGEGHTHQLAPVWGTITTLPKFGNCTETGNTEEIIGTVRTFRQRLQFRPVGNVPAFGTDPAYGRIRRHAASRGHLVIVQITLCGDRCGIVLVDTTGPNRFGHRQACSAGCRPSIPLRRSLSCGSARPRNPVPGAYRRSHRRD